MNSFYIMWPLTCIQRCLRKYSGALEPFNGPYRASDLRYHLIVWSWSCRAVVIECSYVRSGGWKEVASERATRQKSLSEVARSETGLWKDAGSFFWWWLYGKISLMKPLNLLFHWWVIPGTWMSSRFEASRCFKNSWRSFRRNSRAFPGRWGSFSC